MCRADRRPESTMPAGMSELAARCQTSETGPRSACESRQARKASRSARSTAENLKLFFSVKRAMLAIVAAAEVVETDNGIATRKEGVHQRIGDEPRPAGNQNRHRGPIRLLNAARSTKRAAFNPSRLSSVKTFSRPAIYDRQCAYAERTGPTHASSTDGYPRRFRSCARPHED